MSIKMEMRLIKRLRPNENGVNPAKLTPLKPDPENVSIHELREAGRAGSPETSTRCTEIQFLVTGVAREHVCTALLVNERSLVRWIKAFNKYGVDGLIVRKRSGHRRKIMGGCAKQLVELIVCGHTMS